MSPHPLHRFRHPTAERALTLVEIIVVMLILLVITTLGLMGIRGARASGGWVSAVAAAQAYADAADRFAREHDGRYPSPPGTTRSGVVDWDSGTSARRGPKSDSLGTVRYYLPSVPEAVQGGSVVVGSLDARLPSIQYQTVGSGAGYVLTVTVPKGGRTCEIVGGAAPPSTRACEAR